MQDRSTLPCVPGWRESHSGWSKLCWARVNGSLRAGWGSNTGLWTELEQDAGVNGMQDWRWKFGATCRTWGWVGGGRICCYADRTNLSTNFLLNIKFLPRNTSWLWSEKKFLSHRFSEWHNSPLSNLPCGKFFFRTEQPMVLDKQVSPSYEGG